MKTLRYHWLLALSLAASNLHAQDRPGEDACKQFASIPIPKKDLDNAPSNCDANALYYGTDGTGHDANFAAARACAYRERTASHGELNPGDIFSGAGILMMIYANGQGVHRNIPLAKRFACELWAAPAETEGRLASLDKLATSKHPKRLDVCDDITSGVMMGVCEGEATGFETIKRQRRMDAMAGSWTPVQKQAFSQLRRAAKAYSAASVDGEVYSGGTAHAAEEIAAGEALDSAFFAAVERVERMKSPPFQASDYPTEDAKLNATYQALIRKMTIEPEDHSGEHVATVKGVREAQRKWLAYREAWVAFGTVLYPAVPADAWRAWLTHERTKYMKESAGNY